MQVDLRVDLRIPVCSLENRRRTDVDLHTLHRPAFYAVVLAKVTSELGRITLLKVSFEGELASARQLHE
jgi:hypothetical protein